MGEDLAERRTQQRREVLRRDLRNHRIDHRDHVHAGFDVKVRHAAVHRRGVGDKPGGEFRIVVHIQEQVRAAQVRREGEWSADQAIEGRPAAHRLLHAAHDVEHHGHPAVVRLRQLIRDGRRRRQGMRSHRRRRLVGPDQVAAEDLGFHLQVEHDRLAIRLIAAVHLHERIEQLRSIGEHLSRAIAQKLACVDTGERHPRHVIHLLVTERSQEQFFARHSNISFVLIQLCSLSCTPRRADLRVPSGRTAGRTASA